MGDTTVLERLLENLHVDVNPFAVCEVSSGWRLRLSGTPWVTIHYIVEGEGVLRFPGHDEAPLHAYTLVVMPAGLLHVVEHAEGSTREEAGDCGPRVDGLLQFVAGPEGDRELQVVCGRLGATYGGNTDLFGHLASPIVLDFSADLAVHQVVDRLLDEQRHPTIGSAAMCAGLMNECVIHILRRMTDDPDLDLRWLAAAEDPHLAPALGEILAHPEAHHTVDSLAARAGMSRSTFHERFTAAFDESPIAYLRQVRLRKAADLLRCTDLGVDAVSSRVGFASRSQFSHAFSDLFGQTPSTFRTTATT